MLLYVIVVAFTCCFNLLDPHWQDYEYFILLLQARSAHDSGDYNGERTATQWAKGLTITSIVLGILTVVVVVVLFVTVISVASKEQHDLIDGLSRIDDGLSSMGDGI